MRMPKCSGIPERAGVEVIGEHQFAARTSDDLQQCEPARGRWYVADGSTDVARRRFWPGASAFEPVSSYRRFFDSDMQWLIPAPWKGGAQRVSDAVLRPV